MSFNFFVNSNIPTFKFDITVKYSWYLIFVVLFLYSCQSDYTKNEVILRAESIMSDHTDSAYQMLSAMPHPEKMSKADYAAWCLHYSFCQYRLKLLTTDSLIKVALQYYDNSNLNKYTGTAYYLEGYYNVLKNRNNEAMIYLKKADEILRTTNEFKIKGLVAFNLGYICVDDQLYTYALSYFKKSLKYFKMANEPKYEAYAYREISYMYTQLNYPIDTIIVYSNIALKLSKEANDSVNYYSVLVRHGILMNKKGNYELSNNYILKGFNRFPDKKGFNATFLVYNYLSLREIDSAKYYLKIALQDTADVPYRIESLNAAALMALRENDFKQAYSFQKKAYERAALTYQKSIQAQLYRIDKQYNLSEKEKENAALQLENSNNEILIFVLLVVVMAVVAIALLIRARHKKIELEKELYKAEAENVRITNAQKQAILRLKLTEKIANTLEYSKLNSSFLQMSKREEFNAQLAERSILTQGMWQQYIDEVNQLYDNRINDLKTQFEGLTQPDLIVIALICLKVSISDSIILLNMTKNTMYTRRKTIKKRLGLEVDVDLEQWVVDTIVK